MSAIPPLNGRSAAAQFLEDHDHLERELMLSRDEVAALKEQVNQLSNMNTLQAQENDRLRELIAQERARGDKFQRYTVSLSTHLTAVEEAFKRARQMGLEAAQEEARNGGSELAPQDQTRLAELVERLPANRLG